MTPNAAVPVFEIDQNEEFSEYMLEREVDILFNLNILLRQKAVLTLYADEGQNFVLTSIIDIDEASKTIYLDASENPVYSKFSASGKTYTLSGSTIERIKIQGRLDDLRSVSHNGLPAFAARLPERLLRLQRRAFFRIATPRANPISCNVPLGENEWLKLPLQDISGGGICLFGKVVHSRFFSLGHLFHDARLEVPGEGVISVNLRICEVLMTETEIGEPQVRVGCEFISLPASRQQLIERYITRLERERKAQPESR